MCRTGGRRCKGSHASSRATQKTRKQRSRAKQALRKAQTSGDADAIRKATERLDAANAAHQAAKEKAVSHNDNAGQHGDVTAENAAPEPRTEDTVRQTGNVTNIVYGENHGYQTGHINGGLTFNASTGRATIGNNRGDGGDVTFTVGGARNHSAHTQDRARYQEERARYRQERERYKAERAARTGQGASQTGGSDAVNITDANGNVFLQAGSVRGGVWVNGKRVQ